MPATAAAVSLSGRASAVSTVAFIDSHVYFFDSKTAGQQKRITERGWRYVASRQSGWDVRSVVRSFRDQEKAEKLQGRGQFLEKI